MYEDMAKIRVVSNWMTQICKSEAILLIFVWGLLHLWDICTGNHRFRREHTGLRG